MSLRALRLLMILFTLIIFAIFSSGCKQDENEPNCWAKHPDDYQEVCQK